MLYLHIHITFAIGIAMLQFFNWCLTEGTTEKMQRGLQLIEEDPDSDPENAAAGYLLQVK